MYGASAPYGSDKDSVTDPLERAAVDTAVKPIPKTMRFDIFGTHEPVAAHELTKDLPDRIRQTNSGHTHAQNASSQVQAGSTIDLVEGSTGAGGLDALGSNPPPVEFSIESVAADCQFTKVTRFQLGNSTTTATGVTPSASSYGQNVTASTILFKAQNVDPLRSCNASTGVSAVHSFG